MPNFNSREVARKICTDILKLDGVAPTDRAEQILDSALLAAHPEAGELAEQIMSYDISGEDAGVLFAAALETAKREGEPKWISVGDKLPPQNEAVLVMNVNGTSLDEREPVVGLLDDKDWFKAWSSEKLIVTHWVPLPELPKEPHP